MLFQLMAAGWVVTIVLWFSDPQHVGAKEVAPPKVAVDPAPVSRELKAATSFAPVIKKVAPSVVNIYTTKTQRENADPRGNPYSDPIFRYFFGDNWEERARRQPRTWQEQSLGSGVIVSEDGYILTNNHVVEGADEIKVARADNNEVYTAKVIGADPPTDIAVLKIDEEQKLPAITVTDSDQLEVGDMVLAIGNPFGVGQTVTMGIVSAVGRGGFDILDYEDFIQTDASINPGNSGGALVDAQGRLVAVSTAILSRTGGNQGVGFAVPANLARTVMNRIITDGKMTRGFLGVNIQPITPELAKAFEFPDKAGALVGGVSPEGPAAGAGIKEGDVILEFNGRKVQDSRHLRLMVAQTPPGTESSLKVRRDGKDRSFKVTLDELPVEETARLGRRSAPQREEPESLEGLELGDIDSRMRRQLGLPQRLEGVVVLNVDPGSRAAAAGLNAGDVILEVNRQPVGSAEEFAKQINGNRSGRLLLRVWSRGGSRYVVLDAGKPRKP